jgi:hypothetical protein
VGKTADSPSGLAVESRGFGAGNGTLNRLQASMKSETARKDSRSMATDIIAERGER